MTSITKEQDEMPRGRHSSGTCTTISLPFKILNFQTDTSSAMSNSMLRAAPPLDKRLRNIPNSTMSHTTDLTWAAWPYSDEQHHLDQDVLFVERNTLTKLGWQVSQTLLSKERSPEDINVQLEAEFLAERFSAWRDNLPPVLRYRKGVSQPLHVLQLVPLTQNLTRCSPPFPLPLPIFP